MYYLEIRERTKLISMPIHGPKLMERNQEKKEKEGKRKVDALDNMMKKNDLCVSVCV